MSPVNKDHFTSFKSSCLSFSCLIALARTSNTMLNRSDKSRHLCFIPDFRERALSFTTEYDVSYGLFIYGPYHVKEVSFYF